MPRREDGKREDNIRRLKICEDSNDICQILSNDGIKIKAVYFRRIANAFSSADYVNPFGSGTFFIQKNVYPMLVVGES